MYGMMQGTSMWLGGAMMWIFWILLAILVVAIIKAVAGRSSRDISDDDKPLMILKQRYARGEIDEHEYRARRRDLQH